MSVSCTTLTLSWLHHTPLDVLELYRKLVAATKPAEIDLVPILAFDPANAI
jgi:hypothetical protein